MSKVDELFLPYTDEELAGFLGRALESAKEDPYNTLSTGIRNEDIMRIAPYLGKVLREELELWDTDFVGTCDECGETRLVHRVCMKTVIMKDDFTVADFVNPRPVKVCDFCEHEWENYEPF
jgi:hypothetical protein